MITSIEMMDFLSHANTKLEFGKGITVFVGENGSGKTSIIDAITFAFFGQHTRKSNKSLIRRGTNQGFARIEFSINGERYEAVRKIDSKGSLAATFSKMVGDDRIEIAAGERRQFGESMTQEIEKRIGLNFEKLKVASIVQQGELNAIINARPKEFKELLNAIIGIDKLDVASESMKVVNKEFRERIRADLGYDDTHIEILTRDLETHRKEIEESAPVHERLKSEQRELQNEISMLRERIETDTPKIDKIKHLESRKKELLAYAKEAIHEIQREVNENERKIHDCENCFEHTGLRDGLESKIQKIEQAVEDTVRDIQEMTNQAISLKEKQLLASKLQLKDGKCPVCDSDVQKLNPLFQEEHIQQKIMELKKQVISKEAERETYNQKLKEFSAKLQNARDAEATLRAHGIKSEEEIARIREETETKKQRITVADDGNLAKISDIDSHAMLIFESISKLEDEVKGFDQNEFDGVKKSINEKQMGLSQMDQQIGVISEKISKGKIQIKNIQNVISELEVVKEYAASLNQIQMNVFSRDGPVATSLRSWALNAISAKASEYLILLDTKIQRISLSEKTRDIAIACHSKNEILELESLSGGEKVSVALALRLGMASLLGASNLNLMILDEPTTHLDAERKKSLVRVLSQISDGSDLETQMQFLIITHDAEIFEDSTVDQIYKFESSSQGSKVIPI